MRALWPVAFFPPRPSPSCIKASNVLARRRAKNALYKSENADLRNALQHVEQRKRAARQLHPEHEPGRAAFFSYAKLAAEIQARADQEAEKEREAARKLAASEQRARDKEDRASEMAQRKAERTRQ